MLSANFHFCRGEVQDEVNVAERPKATAFAGGILPKGRIIGSNPIVYFVNFGGMCEWFMQSRWKRDGLLKARGFKSLFLLQASLVFNGSTVGFQPDSTGSIPVGRSMDIYDMRYVYVIRNLINEKVYVGQTKNFNNRKAGHLAIARHGVLRPLYAAMRKYGVENFTFEVIEECPDECY